MTQAELVRYYEQRLAKVKAMHNPANTNSIVLKERCQAYIEDAEAQLEAVKSGRGW